MKNHGATVALQLQHIFTCIAIRAGEVDSKNLINHLMI